MGQWRRGLGGSISALQEICKGCGGWLRFGVGFLRPMRLFILYDGYCKWKCYPLVRICNSWEKIWL